MEIFNTLILTILISITSYSQNCGIGSVNFSSQTEVNQFITAHTAPNPTCDRIDGDLYIGNTLGSLNLSDINDISGLTFLTSTNRNGNNYKN